MKKIPTLFERQFDNHRIVGISDKITEGCEEAFLNGKATVKIDGTCCAIIGGKFYKRYDAKKGKKVPDGAIPCCDPDPVTGHWPHWVEVNMDDKADKYFVEAYNNLTDKTDGTYELIGPKIQGNPYLRSEHMLCRHGEIEVEVGRTFEEIKNWLMSYNVEGIVFWLNGEPVCKIKRSDFGLKFPMKGFGCDIYPIYLSPFDFWPSCIKEEYMGTDNVKEEMCDMKDFVYSDTDSVKEDK